MQSKEVVENVDAAEANSKNPSLAEQLDETLLYNSRMKPEELGLSSTQNTQNEKIFSGTSQVQTSNQKSIPKPVRKESIKIKHKESEKLQQLKLPAAPQPIEKSPV